MLPGTQTTYANGQLGRIAPSEDGISSIILSGVAVAGKFALGDVLGPFVQLADAEAMGIDSAYDQTNATIAWKHIKDFYEQAPKGTQLYAMVVAATQTLTTTCLLATANGLKKLLVAGDGTIKMVGLTFTPDGTYTPAYTNQLESDLWTAIANLKLTWADELTFRRPFRAIIEGRNFQGSPSTIKNLRDASATPAANMAMVVIGNDYDYDNPLASLPIRKKYASVGAALGMAAACKVNRNIGRVKNGATLISTGGFSNGAKATSLTETQWGQLNDYGYVFLRKQPYKSGWFWNQDHMACVSTDDYAQLRLGRTMDKINRIVHKTNVDEILDELEVDTTGKIAVAKAADYQALIDDQINAQMASNKEIIFNPAGYTFVDPNQNVLATSKFKEVIKAIPYGCVEEIESVLEYTNPLNQ